MKDPDFTLSAGPTTVSARVRAAMAAPMVYHYDPSFIAAFRRTERKVAQLLATENDILLMQGEAVLGLEAAAKSLVTPGMHVLNLVSGVFGKGMGYWLQGFGAELHEIEVGYDDAIDPEQVERALAQNPSIELLSVVHCETPSGTLDPLEEIAAIAAAHDVLTFVDCVSSVAGTPFLGDRWHLDVSVLGPQKCMGGPPGMSLMSISEKAWEMIGRNPAAPRASFLSMLDWKEQWLGAEHFPYTPSVADLRGVEAACDDVLEEGIDASIARHERAARATRSGARAMGLELWPRSDEIAAPCVTSIKVPDGLTDDHVRAHARERYGVMLSGGQGAGNLVRIGHMGPTASSVYPVIGLSALGRTLLDLGARVNVGAGVEASLEVLSAEPLAVV